jgi:hypothetical protein
MAIYGYGPSPYLFGSVEGLEAAIDAALIEHPPMQVAVLPEGPLPQPESQGLPTIAESLSSERNTPTPEVSFRHQRSK